MGTVNHTMLLDLSDCGMETYFVTDAGLDVRRREKEHYCRSLEQYIK